MPVQLPKSRKHIRRQPKHRRIHATTKVMKRRRITGGSPPNELYAMPNNISLSHNRQAALKKVNEEYTYGDTTPNNFTTVHSSPGYKEPVQPNSLYGHSSGNPLGYGKRHPTPLENNYSATHQPRHPVSPNPIYETVGNQSISYKRDIIVNKNNFMNDFVKLLRIIYDKVRNRDNKKLLTIEYIKKIMETINNIKTQIFNCNNTNCNITANDATNYSRLYASFSDSNAPYNFPEIIPTPKRTFLGLFTRKNKKNKSTNQTQKLHASNNNTVLNSISMFTNMINSYLDSIHKGNWIIKQAKEMVNSGSGNSPYQ